MKIVAGMLCKNEDWVLKASIPAALEWCDEVVYYDDNSTDESWGIANSFGPRVHCSKVDVKTVFWDEMERREELAQLVYDLKPDVFALVDADEILSIPLRTDIRMFLDRTKKNSTLAVPMGCPWNSLDQIRVDNCSWTRAKWTTAIKLDWNHLPSWKPRDGYEHHNREAGVPLQFISNSTAFNTHLQFANLPRRLWKHIWYAGTELIRWSATRQQSTAKALNPKYCEAFNESNIKLKETPPYYFRSDEKSVIDVTSPGWYKDECEALLASYGPSYFKDLILWRENFESVKQA